jgi:hypothetical protein
MKNLFKSLAISALVGLISLSSAFGQFNTTSPTPSYTVVTNTGTNSGFFLILTNAAKIANVQVVGGTTYSSVNIYDDKNGTGLWTNSAYATLSNYVSNVVYTSVSPLTGVTNIQTNLQLVTVTVTNAAATNTLPYRTFVAAPNTVSSYNVDMIQARGITLYANSNGSGTTVVITYRPND